MPEAIDNVTVLMPGAPGPLDMFWAMEPNYLSRVLGQIAAGPRQPTLDAPARSEMEIDRNGVATIDLVGPIQAYRDLYTKYFGGSVTSEVIADLRKAMNDASVKSIMLYVDSPGGTVAGTAELAAAVREANAVKPVVAYIANIGASAAYWAASQASQIVASETALIGSIGTRMTMYDLHRLADNLGIEVVPIGSAPMKSAGTPGTIITDAHKADFQRLVGQLNERFVSAVSEGRKLTGDRLAAVTDARVHVGAAAQALGLVDHIGGPDVAMGHAIKLGETKRGGTNTAIRVETPLAHQADAGAPLAETSPSTSSSGEPTSSPESEAAMPEGNSTTTTPTANAVEGKPSTTATPSAQPAANAGQPTRQAASMSEMKKAFPKANAEFLVEQAAAGATLAEAKDAYIAHLERSAAETAQAAEAAQVAEATEAAKAQAMNAGGSGKARGAQPVPSAGEAGGSAVEGADAIAEFDAAVTKVSVDQKIDRHAAAAKVLSADPAMRQRYVTSVIALRRTESSQR